MRRARRTHTNPSKQSAQYDAGSTNVTERIIRKLTPTCARGERREENSCCHQVLHLSIASTRCSCWTRQRCCHTTNLINGTKAGLGADDVARSPLQKYIQGEVCGDLRTKPSRKRILRGNWKTVRQRTKLLFTNGKSHWYHINDLE